MSTTLAPTWAREHAVLAGVGYGRDITSAAMTPQSLAELSHDLRTPLASVRLLVAALRDELVEPEWRDQTLDRIEQQLEFVTELVDQLHSRARRRARVDKSRSEWISPQQLIDAAAETMRIQAEARGVSLETDASSSLPTIRVSRIQLHRALLNLLENAIRHARAGGTVALRIRRSFGGVEIEVEDDGEGIRTEERAHVFTAFYGEDRRASTGRSGLGLAIARAIVEANGGRIWVTDSAGGARIRLWLPAGSASGARLTVEPGCNS